MVVIENRREKIVSHPPVGTEKMLPGRTDVHRGLGGEEIFSTIFKKLENGCY